VPLDNRDLVLDCSTITPDLLTGILHNSSTIPADTEIVAVSVLKTYRCSLSIAHLEARLSNGEVLKLVLKFCEPGQQTGRAEVDFYRSIAPGFPPDVLPKCLHTGYCVESRRMSLLFEDLQPRFEPMVTEVPALPAEHVRLAVLHWLTALQASYWNRPELNDPLYWRSWRTESALQAWFDTRHAQTEAELQVGPDKLDSEVMELYHDLRRHTAHRLAGRLASGRNLTLIHGDAHGGNFLVSSGSKPDIRLLDWPNWRPGLPTDDIAYLVAAWPGEQQAQALKTARQLFFNELPGSQSKTLDYTERDWVSDLSLSASWVFVYSIGLIGECRQPWTYLLARRVASLAAIAASMD
jgi:Phosphotransferase enzyme family